MFGTMLIAAVSCSKSGDGGALPVWRATDHDQNSTPGSEQAAAAAAPTTSLGAALWQRQCSLCHGLEGRGDGSNGAALHVPNMTSVAWQKSKTDTELMLSIKNGKGAMPRFSLADEALKAVVEHIRSFAQK